MIPVSEPLIGKAEEELVLAALREGQISAGRFVREFEERWAAYCGRRHGVAVTSGTTALELAVACLELEPGDEIIMPAFTIMSCALAAVRAGAIPRLVDADPRTWCMDPSGIAQLVGPRARAIMPVHIYGHPVDMDAVLDVARKHGLAVIEDAAEAHGAEYLSAGADWRRCGGFGELSCFSFYANKLVTSGEGGMVLTDSDALAEKARRLRNLAFGPGRRFRHEELGFNFRMTNLQAALAIPQIERMHEIVGRKRAIAAQYAAALAGVRGIQLPVEEAWARSVYWMYGIVIDTATGRDAESVAAKLAESGIETRPFFLGLHEQPALRRLGLFSGASYPMTERLARQGLYLPSGIGLRADDIGAVAEAVRQALA